MASSRLPFPWLKPILCNGECTMTQNFSETVMLGNLAEVDRLILYIQQNAIDSEQQPVRMEEVPIVAGLVLQRLVWRSPNLEQVLQEVLDDLRFRGH
jgi:hypothetical protein